MEQQPNTVLIEILDETVAALTAVDANRLEAIEDRLHIWTAESAGRGLAEQSLTGNREALPELLRKHTLLGELLNATAANLKVMVSVVEAKRIRTDGRNDFQWLP